jgi:putative ABC transport system permease protein
VMFGRAISWSSYALSALLTFFFAALVNLVMMFRLRKIDMATTLKSNE